MPIEQINGHSMYYESHGEGDPVLLMGGWGTFCHGEHHHLPWGLTDRYQVIIFDHRGIGESGDDLTVAPTTRLYAKDAIDLLDHLGLSNVHLLGFVGLGACITQEIALERPDLARSLINTGCWAKVDTFLRDQLESLRDVHKELGFLAFQKLVSVLSFEPNYYNKNKDRMLGPDGVWGQLNGRYPAHERLVHACLDHNTSERLHLIDAPSLVIHAPLDEVTGPRVTQVIEDKIPGAMGVTLDGAAHVIAGKDLKIKFAELVMSFLNSH